MLIILIFIAVLHISANPLPASSTDLAVSGDSLPIDTDSVITDNLPDGGCNGDNASTESLNGTVNPGLSILQRHSFQKRSTRSCPANILNPYGQPSGSNRYTKWRAPSEEELPVLDAYDIFSPWGNPKGKCKDKFKLTLLTCGGPEVWYKEILGFVLNCVLGSASRIPKREPFPDAHIINEYCCNTQIFEKPLEAAFMCDRITKNFPIKVWWYQDLNAWIDSGYDPKFYNREAHNH